MMIDLDNLVFDNEGVETSSVASGSWVDRPGMYHMELRSVDFELDTEKADGSPVSPHIKLTFEVLKSVDGQSGKGSAFIHRIYVAGKGGERLSDGGLQMLRKAALNLGVLHDQDGRLVDKQGKQSLSIRDFGDLELQQYIVPISMDEGTKAEDGSWKYKPKAVVDYQNFHDLDDPRFADVPRDVIAAQAIGKCMDRKQEEQDDQFGEDF